MILILSENYDNSTNQVVSYLHSYGLPYIRINETDKVRIIHGTICNEKVDFKFFVKGKEFCLSDITFYWYRRGGFFIDLLRSNIPKQLERYLKRDLERYELFFDDLFKSSVPSIGSVKHNSLNKLTVLQRAVASGLQIPDTFFISRKKDFKSMPQCISKGVFDTLRFSINQSKYHGPTTLVDTQLINQLSDTFPVSMVQKAIDKTIEIRSFYWDKAFFHMAINSQDNEKTQYDFRNYDWFNPNRVYPCTIPKGIENWIFR